MFARMRRALLASCVAVASVAAPALSHAADFYKGKTITIIVGFSPGGGYDTYARLLAQYLPNFVPGHPTVIVQNMPGAGSLTAVRSLDATQAKDGTVLAVFNTGLITESIVEPKLIQLDFRKLAWVGIATPDFRVCYGYGKSGPKTWDQMMRMKQFVLGTTGKGAADYVNGQTLKDVFNAPIKQIIGFPGSAEQRIAVEQGELNGDCGTFSSIPVDWLRDGKAHVFARFTEFRPSYEPASAEFVKDFATTDDQKKLIDFLDASNEVGRPFAMSSSVPADRLAILRKAFDDAMKDPTLIAQAQKEQIPVSPLSGQRAAEIVSTQMANISPGLVAKAKQIFE
jgi:tripartite-type tricarboxylate transporter receptor subunit TctC